MSAKPLIIPTLRIGIGLVSILVISALSACGDSGQDNPAVDPGCMVFGGPGELDTIRGLGPSFEVEPNVYQLVGGTATEGASMIINFGALVTAGSTDPNLCLTDVNLIGAPDPLLDPFASGADHLLKAHDGVQAGGSAWLYYALFEAAPEEYFGYRLVGYGVSERDAPTGRYTPNATLLWDADAPAYGRAVVRQGNTVYVFGCKGVPDTFRSDCFVARVAEDSLADPSAYTYYAGSVGWSPEPTDAAAVFSSGGTISVRFHGDVSRWVVTYVPTFGDTLELRSAPAPEGPWSDPEMLARCEVPPDDEQAFCEGAFQHPALAAGPHELVLGYSIVTFAEDAEARIVQAPQRYWPRLVRVPRPDF